MNSGSKLRMHMGCGEPLRSRSWLAKSLQPESSAGGALKSKSLRRGPAAGRREGKCRP
jgi:hypothetical protein